MYKLVKPLLFKLDPERAWFDHQCVEVCSKCSPILPIVNKLFTYNNPILTQHIHGISFDNPIGLAAGFDKSCEVPKALENIGFGAIELGGITPKPQPGNPKPRMYRLLEDDALINRMGFNNKGMNKALSNLRNHSCSIPVGLNVGVNKTTSYENRYQDYIKVIDTFKNDVSFFTVNISSPNTENLQNFHDEDEFSMLCDALNSFKAKNNINVPIFLKLTSDMELDGFKNLAFNYRYIRWGYVGKYDTTTRWIKFKNKIQKGGLSGRPLFQRNLQLVKYAYQQTRGNFLIIGTGGIFSSEDAIKMLRNGASLLQIYSSLVIEGPGLTKKMNKEIAHYLTRHGYANVSDIIGLDA